MRITFFSQISDSYPANVIVDTNVLYIVKFWTNDGTVMISCSEPDGKKGCNVVCLQIKAIKMMNEKSIHKECGVAM